MQQFSWLEEMEREARPFLGLRLRPRGDWISRGADRPSLVPVALAEKAPVGREVRRGQ